MNYIYDEVLKLKKKHDTNNPFEIMEQEGIILRHCSGFTKLKGYYCLSNGFRYAGVNVNLDEQMQKIVAGHELGHDILHRHIAQAGPMHDVLLYSSASKTAKEANEFSANLLISDDDVLDQLGNNYSYFELSNLLSYPLEIIQFKLNSMRQRGFKLNLCDMPDSQFLK